MELNFVNHASFIIKVNDKRIITDPRLEFRAFNEEWELLSQTYCKMIEEGKNRDARFNTLSEYYKEEI